MQNKAIPGFQDGGMQVEPTTGNDVPVGSLPEEVADDVDAKLSPGEFVLPADVVRFIGLERLMKMRDEAKEGLRRMSEIGQMGNAEEVGEGADDTYEDDNFESNIDSILSEVGEEDDNDVAQQTEMAFAEGGAVPETTFMGGSDLSKATGNPMVDIRYFKDSKGNTIFVTFINGRPMTPIPQGYTATDSPVAKQVGREAEKKEEVAKEAAKDVAGADSGGAGGSIDGGGVNAGTATGLGVSPNTTNALGQAAAGQLGAMLGGAIGGVPGALAGRYAGQQIAKGLQTQSTLSDFSSSLGKAGFSNEAVNAAISAGKEAAGAKDATYGSISAAAAQAAADVDNVDSMEAMMSVTDAFDTAPQGYSADFGYSYGGSGDTSTSDDGGFGDTQGSGNTGGDDGAGDSDSSDSSDSGDSSDSDSGYAKGGLVKRRKNAVIKPAKPSKGLASRKR